MWLVTEGKNRINQLGYDKNTQEYVYIHKGVEIWREKGDKSLLNYFSNLRASNTCINEKEIEKNQVWIRYIHSCDNMANI